MKKEIKSHTSEPTAESVAIVSETTDLPCIDAGGTTETEVSAVASQDLLERLLSMAQRYRKEGSYQQAIELFWTLVEEHSEAPQAATAKTELLALADEYECKNNRHMARSIYERLMALEN